MSFHLRPIVLSLAVMGGAALPSCGSTGDPEPFVPSKPGASQPEGSGDSVSEAHACDRLEAAITDVRAELDCSEVALGCPELIRPAGSDPCSLYRYDETSLDACLEVIEGYGSCGDFDRTPCLVTAIVTSNDGCGAGGDGGSPGTAGGAGQAGLAGRAGSFD